MIPAAAIAPTLRRIVIAAVVATSAATLALILVVLVLPARAAVALHWYLVGVGVIVVLAGMRALLARYPVRWQANLDPTPRVPAEPPEIPARLRAIHRLVSRAKWDPAGLRLELLPILRAIAAQRLLTYRTIDMERNPEAARAVLGERVWAFLVPAGQEDRAIDLADPGITVETLEKLDDIADD